MQITAINNSNVSYEFNLRSRLLIDALVPTKPGLHAEYAHFINNRESNGK